MQLDRPFKVVTSAVDGDVLAVLARVDTDLTPPQVHRLIGNWSIEGVRKALERLVEQGVVIQRSAGRARIYRLNRAHLAAGAIIELASQRDELIERLRERLGAWFAPCEYAALFGSASSGGMRADSDIDIFVVRPDELDPDEEVWRSQLSALALDVTSWTGNDTRVLEYTTRQFRAGRADGDRVLEDIARDGLVLAGPDSYLIAQQGG